MAELPLDDEFEDFLDKIDEITSVIKGFTSKDPDTSMAALTTASHILGLHQHSPEHSPPLPTLNLPQKAREQVGPKINHNPNQNKGDNAKSPQENRNGAKQLQENQNNSISPPKSYHNLAADESPARPKTNDNVTAANDQSEGLRFARTAGCVTKWNRTLINTKEMTPQERWMAEVEADAKRRAEESKEEEWRKRMEEERRNREKEKRRKREEEERRKQEEEERSKRAEEEKKQQEDHTLDGRNAYQ